MGFHKLNVSMEIALDRETENFQYLEAHHTAFQSLTAHLKVNTILTWAA